jgi:hypothetical protein
MAKGKGGNDEDTRGLKAKAQKQASADEKARQAADQAKASAAADWSDGANTRAKNKAASEQEKEAAKQAAKDAKAAALAADEAELANMRVKPGKARKANQGKKKKGGGMDVSMLEAFLSPAEKAKLGKKKSVAMVKTAPSPAASTTKADAYDLLKPNPNRANAAAAAAGHVDATSIDGALEALTVGAADEGEDRNALKRGKALYMAFEERMMAEFKEEKLGLKRSQMKDRIWKAWQKAPENPFREANK